MATPKNFINSVVFAKPNFSQADGLPRFYPTVDLQGGNIENVVLINGELPITVPPTGGYVRYDACDGTIYDLSVNLMNGASNIQLGYQAGDYGKGSRNVMVGYFAANGTGTDLSDSVVIGTQAGVNSDGSNNVFIGPYSGYYTGGSNNVYIGSNAGYDMNGSNNIFLGPNAGYDMSGINSNNIFIGRNAGQLLTDISDMFIVGDAGDTLMIGYMKQHRLDVCGNLNIANSINNFQYFKTGTVGINTSNPDNDYVLDVSGASIVRGNLDVCGNIYVAGNIIYDGSGINIDISNGGLTLTGTGAAPATLQVRDGGVTINNDGVQGAYMTLGYKSNYTKNNANYMIDCSGNVATSGRYGFSRITTNASNDLSANISCPSAGALAFNTNATESMRITSSGNVGIGITDPSGYKLDVSGGQVRFTTSTGINGITHTAASVNLSTFIGATSGAWFGTTTNHPLSFYTNNSGARLYIDTSGNVGVGTTTPAFKLDINGSTNIFSNSSDALTLNGTAPNISMTNTDTTSLRITPTGGSTYIESSGNLLITGPFGAQLNRKVGINNTNPQYSLDVSGSIRVSNSIQTAYNGTTIIGPNYSFKMTGFGIEFPEDSSWNNITSYSFDDISTNSGKKSYGISLGSGTYTVPLSGVYGLGFTVRVVAGQDTSGYRIFNQANNNSYPNSYGQFTYIDGSSYTRRQTTYTTIQYLSAGDTLVVQGYSDSGGTTEMQYIEFWGYLLHSV